MTKEDELTRAVVRVGDGRGFVVARGCKRVIITAAHCLPWKKLPRPLARYLEEQTFTNLLGPLGRKRTVWTECRFVDRIADIAVLGTPDTQALSDEADAFDDLVDKVTPLAVAKAPVQKVITENRLGAITILRDATGPAEVITEPFTSQRFADATGPVRVLSLNGQWLDATARRGGGRAPSSPSPWLTVEPGRLIEGGMSGSPMIRPDGAAMAVISTNNVGPIILEALPAHMARALARKHATKRTRAVA